MSPFYAHVRTRGLPRTRRARRSGVAAIVAVTLVLGLLPAWQRPALAKPVIPPGGSAAAPQQAQGDAKGRTHRAMANETRSGAGTVPPGEPTPPPAVKTVGPEVKYPDPVIPTTGAGKQPVALSQGSRTQRGQITPKSKELADKRTARSTEFANPDGTKTRRVYQDDVFTQDASGRMAPVDTSLTERGGRLTPKVAPGKMSFARQANDGALAQVEISDKVSVGFSLQEAKVAQAVVDGSRAKFAGVRPHSDLVLAAGTSALKEDIVLASAEAPTSWAFTLKLRGLTPQLQQSGSVDLVDAAGAVRSVIPPGYMVDSAVDPKTGQGNRSDNVTYTLVRQGDSWTLRVDLDADWLRRPERKFPVTVDPTVRLYTKTACASTAPRFRDRDNYGCPYVGTMDASYYNEPDRWGEWAMYMKFPSIWNDLSYKYILGASLNLFNAGTISCSPQPLSVYAVREDWDRVIAWPGPAYDGINPLWTGNLPPAKQRCSNGQDWVAIQIPADRFTRWTHGYDSPFYGFTLRAPANSPQAFREFASPEGLYNTPFMDVVYADQGAEYAAPTGIFDPPVTAGTKGTLTVRASNWGQDTWTPGNGYKLVGIVRNSAGAEVHRASAAVPQDTVRGWSVDIPLQVGPLPIGDYSLRLTMADPSGRLFDEFYQVPAATATFSVGNGVPVIKGQSPPNNGFVDTLRPSLWANYYDPDNNPPGKRSFWFQICNGTPDAPTGCQESGWISSAAWPVPGGVLSWSKASFWYVQVSDTVTPSPKIGPFYLTPVVAQPEVTSHLAGAPQSADLPDVNPQVGNYTTGATDVAVSVPGPSLTVQRTYNSQDLRTTGAFGAGWASPLDQRLTLDPDGSGNAVITLSTGLTARFGRNADDTYAAPLGVNMTLVHQAAAGGTPETWTLRDPSGERRMFDAAGRLVAIADAEGRQQEYRFDDSGTQVSQIRDATSGRSLWLTWLGGHVSAVATDPPQVGQPAPTWTYTYTGAQLTKVCAPVSAQSCTEYRYDTGTSHYRSVVMDDNPTGYWPLGESGGNSAANVAARGAGEWDGLFRGAGYGEPGALAGSNDTAAKFAGGTASGGAHVRLPDNLLNTTQTLAVEAWFKTTGAGVVIGQQNFELGAANAYRYSSVVYVGTDGKLRGGLEVAPFGPPITSTNPVNDGQWHHVVLSAAVDAQTLYLDGTAVGSVTGKPINHQAMAVATIGTGYADPGNWPQTPSPGGYFAFVGAIDEVAVYRHPLGALQVAGHWAARTATSRMTSVVEPGNVTAMKLTYDRASGRVATVTDRNGATWTLGAPVLGNRTRAVTLSSTSRSPITYTFDTDHNGRIISRSDVYGTRKWVYNAAGFLSEYRNENGHAHFYGTDSRGNVTWEAVWYVDHYIYQMSDYYLNATDPLDPRNDKVNWQTDGRSEWNLLFQYRTWFFYDAAGRTTSIAHPVSTKTGAWAYESLTYSKGTESAEGGGTVPPGLLLQYTAPTGDVTKHAYNPRGDRVRTTDPVGLETGYGYDGLGRVTTTSRASHVGGVDVDYGTTTVTYNALSQVATSTAPPVTNPITGVTHTEKTTYSYDPMGRLRQAEVADTTGGDATRVTKQDYDAAGRPTVTTAADNTTTTSEWNAAGDLVRQTLPGGLVKEYRYDDGHRLVEVAATGSNVDPTDPSSTRMVIEARAYDPAGQLARLVDAAGRETDYTYFETGWPATDQQVRRDTSGTVTWSLTTATREYDGGGNLTRLTEPGGIVHDYSYDYPGDLVAEGLDAGGMQRLTTYQRRNGGQVTGTVVTNGFTFRTATAAETPFLADAGASKIDAVGSRYADKDASWTYKFALPADTTSATLTLDLAYEFLIEGSVDRTNWVELTREKTRGQVNNRSFHPLDLAPVLAKGKTIYLRFRDSFPDDGNGPNLTQATLRYTRDGESPRNAGYGYDAAGRTVTTTVDNPGGTPSALTETLTRDPRGLVVARTDTSGATTNFSYDVADRPVSAVRPAVSVWNGDQRTDGVRPATTLGRNTFGDLTDQRDPTGAVSRATFDAMGRTVEASLPSYTAPGGTQLTAKRTIKYNDLGVPVEETDPLGRVTGRSYNKYGWLETVTQPDPDRDGPRAPPVTSYAYDRVGQVLKVTGPTGAQTQSTYDEFGRQITLTTAERETGTTVYYTTQFGRDDAGNVTSTITPLNHKTTVEYNKAGQPVKTTDPTGLVIEQRYTATGQPAAEIVAGKRATSYAYDAAGRQVGVSDHTVSGGVLSNPLRTATTSYDDAGRPARSTSAEGRPTSYGYDAGGQLTSVTQLRDPADPGSAVTVDLGYDVAGRRARMVDGNRNVTTYTYNSWGLPESTVEPAIAGATSDAARAWTTAYDAAGQPVRELLPGGVSRTRTFDDLGRVTADAGTGTGLSSPMKTLDYDAAGQITKVSGPAGDYAYTWNDRGMLTRTTGPSGTATFTYDAEGNLKTRADAAGSGSFEYDAAGRMTKSVDPLSGATATYGHEVTGEVKSVQYGTGKPSRAMTYDDFGRLATDTVKKADGSTAVSVTYGYDKDDSVTSRNTTGLAGSGTNAYGYDGLGRLTTWSRPDGQKVTYGYDGASNRTSVAGPAGTRTFTFDARNRLVSATGGGEADLTAQWSDRGVLDSLTQGGDKKTFAYDAFDHLRSASGPGYTTTYAYDALDRVAQRNGVTVGYADLTNDAVSAPTAGGDAKLFRAPDGTAISDKVGSGAGRLLVSDLNHGDQLAAIAPDTGAVAASASYSPYGERAASSGTLSLGFQGGWTDPSTSQVNAHARWLEPSLGSFTSRDSLTLDPDPVAQANRYLYANANPINYSDPSGHTAIPLPLPVPGLLAGAGGLLAGVGAVVTSPAVIGGAVLVGSVALIGYAGYKAYQLTDSRPLPISNQNLGGAGSVSSVGSSIASAAAAAATAAAVAAAVAATDAMINRSRAIIADLWDLNAKFAQLEIRRAQLNALQAALDAARAKAAAEEAARLAWLRAEGERAAAIRDAALAATPTVGATTAVLPGTTPLLGAGAVIGAGTSVAAITQATAEDAQTPSNQTGDSGGGGKKPPTLPRGGACMPDPDDGDWVDPNLINFSQRTISPNDYVQAMLNGTWDWNRPGTALRVIDRGGQLVSYDNRRLAAAREVRAQIPDYRVKVERVDPNAPNPAKTSGMSWDKSFEKRMTNRRNRDENGCRVPWQGLFDLPEVK